MGSVLPVHTVKGIPEPQEVGQQRKDSHASFVYRPTNNYFENRQIRESIGKLKTNNL